MRITIILLDAFRRDYISELHTPYLYNFSTYNGISDELEPSEGFCERSEILTGVSSKKLGYLTAIRYDPPNSPYNIKFFSKSINFLKHMKGLQILDMRMFKSIMRRILKLSSSSCAFPVANIPMRALGYFSLSEDLKSHSKKNAFKNAVSLRDLMNKNDIFDMSSFTSLRNERSPFKTDLERLDNNQKTNATHKVGGLEYSFVYISSADANGHMMGPDQFSRSKELRELDKILERHYNGEKAKENYIIYIGDHGMEQINDDIDIQSRIKEVIVKYPKVIETYFLDSTMVRIWFMPNKKALGQEIMNKLFSEFSLFGKSQSPELYAGAAKRENGDYIWCCKPGVLIWPDFFHMKNTKKPLGMHGYINTEVSSNTLSGGFISSDIPCTTFQNKIHSAKTLSDIGKAILEFHKSSDKPLDR